MFKRLRIELLDLFTNFAKGPLKVILSFCAFILLSLILSAKLIKQKKDWISCNFFFF